MNECWSAFLFVGVGGGNCLPLNAAVLVCETFSYLIHSITDSKALLFWEIDFLFHTPLFRRIKICMFSCLLSGSMKTWSH